MMTMAPLVEIVGVPMDLGAGRRGVDMGPSAIRYAGLIDALRAMGLTVNDRGNVNVPLPESSDGNNGAHGVHFAATIARVCQDLAREVRAIVRRGQLPVVLGGDHSLSIGSVGGVAQASRIGVIWLDAHGDFNTPGTSPSGNVHGMPLAVLAGLGDARLVAAAGEPPAVSPDRIALIGARSLDAGEQELLREQGVTVYAMESIDTRGIAAVVEEAVTRLTARADRLHVSLDVDVLDPREAPGVGTPVPGGLTYREARLAMEIIAASGRLGSLDVVEVNPILDERNATGRLASELVLSALGRRGF